MKLRPSSEDCLFGLSPVGSISFAMVLIYYGAVGLRGLGILASGVETAPVAVNFAFESILMIFAFVGFLLTVNVFHRKMVEQKRLEMRRLIERRKEILEVLPQVNNIKVQESLSKRFLVVDIFERRLEKIHTWPFDTGVLGRISTIIVSVRAIMTARVITLILNI